MGELTNRTSDDLGTGAKGGHSKTAAVGLPAAWRIPHGRSCLIQDVQYKTSGMVPLRSMGAMSLPRMRGLPESGSLNNEEQ